MKDHLDYLIDFANNLKGIGFLIYDSTQKITFAVIVLDKNLPNVDKEEIEENKPLGQLKFGGSLQYGFRLIEFINSESNETVECCLNLGCNADVDRIFFIPHILDAQYSINPDLRDPVSQDL